jgi:hypothetical protein
MGMAVPPIHPPMKTYSLNPLPDHINPTKKRPPPPQLPHGLECPCPAPSSKGRKTAWPTDSDAQDTTHPTMQCLDCNSIFKTKNGLIRHLSKKPVRQNAMGMAVPPIHPTIKTFSLNPPPIHTHPTKKRPTPPQLPHGLERPCPPSSKGR